MQTIPPEKLEALADMDFDAASHEPTEPEKAALTEALQPLEPIEFESDAPIEFEALPSTERPFHKRPGPLLVGGAAIVGIGCLGLAAMVGAGSNDLSKVIEKNKSAPVGEPTQATALPDDPRDKVIGDLRSEEASRTLAAEMKKQELERQRKEKDGRTPKVPPTVKPTTLAASSVPETDYTPTERYSSSPRSYSTPSYSSPSSYTPRYQSAPSYSAPRGSSGAAQSVQPPAQKPKMLAFGAMPEDKAATPVQAASSPTSGYQTVSYNNQSPVGFGSNGDALKSQQSAFMSGAAQSRIEINSTAKAVISSGSIMPNRFLVQLTQPLGSIPSGTNIIFEPRTVYPNGKVEAYAVGIARGEYQSIVSVPTGAIALFAPTGKILKAKKPSAGFFNSVAGQMLVGGLSGAASRFLATDSTTTITDAGSQTSSKAGGRGLGDVALSFAQGSVSPLMQQLKPTQTSGKPEFSLEPGQALMVRVLQPFTF